MFIPYRLLVLLVTTLYQTLACLREDQTSPPGTRVDIGGYALHLNVIEPKQLQAETAPPRPTLVLDHSLGGVEGYLLTEHLAQFGRVCIYDRAGYGWSDRSPQPRQSASIVAELDTLLTRAHIAPPYILIGDSFGSYNMRLYAHRFPEKVSGLVLTDGLHESGMLSMPLPLVILKLVFISGFLMSVLGALFGIIRLLKVCAIFELLKPELRKFPAVEVARVKRSFCRPKHWLTMAQELWGINRSGQQVSEAKDLGNLPIVSIKANSFFQPAFWTILIPLKSANSLRDRMHEQLMKLSSKTVQLQAQKSGHFVWIDEPELIAEAVEILLKKI
ncbi:MAG: alpha/beta hydrolase [Cyanobacteria bacterium P01_A01_bin.123]